MAEFTITQNAVMSFQCTK